MAIGDFGSQTDPGIQADHGIVKARASLFKKNRNATINSRTCRARGIRGSYGSDAGSECGPNVRGYPRLSAFREGGCQMHHPLVQASGASDSVAPAPWEYTDNLNEPLTCIVFVPIISLPREATPLAELRG